MTLNDDYSVAVYSSEPGDDAHIQYADEAVQLPTSSLGYNSPETILELAKRTSADCVHPGYGFLSEDPRLPSAIESTNRITFVGPTTKQVELFGDKPSAKRLAREVGIPTLIAHEVQTLEVCLLRTQTLCTILLMIL